jgi:iron complex transport system substrate-binding protein
VGVTHECDFPPSVRSLPRVTRTLIPVDASSAEIDALVRERLKSEKALYSLDMPVLEQVRPDLMVTQALCEVCAVAEAEVQAAACTLPGSPRVLNLEPMTLAQVLDCVLQVGKAAGRQETAEEVVGALRRRVDSVTARSAGIAMRPGVVVLEWLDPFFTAGHWTPELVQMAGGTELIGIGGTPSRTMSHEELIAAAPEVLVISCCGFDIERTMQELPAFLSRPGVADLPAVRSGRVYVMDGNQYLSRPGPRLVESLEILGHLLHPGVHPAPVLPGDPRRSYQRVEALACTTS